MDDTQQSLSFYWSRSVFDLKFFSVQVVSSFQALCAEAIYDLQAEIVETRLLSCSVHGGLLERPDQS